MRRCAHTALFTKMVASTTEMSTSQKMTTIIRQSFSSFGGKLVEEEQSSSLPDFRDGKTRSWSAASNNSSSSRRRYHHQSQRCYSGRGGVLLNDTHDVSRGRREKNSFGSRRGGGRTFVSSSTSHGNSSEAHARARTHRGAHRGHRDAQSRASGVRACAARAQAQAHA